MRTRLLLISTLGILGLAAPVFAQRTTASLRGTVTDSSGSVVPGVSIKVESGATGFTRPRSCRDSSPPP
jgi:hypothetical protein